jgi:uncharacterized protein involved in exopolysaccharide biosynthesis
MEIGGIMKSSRRKFLAVLGAGIAALFLGKFLNLFQPQNERVARFWKRSDTLAG